MTEKPLEICKMLTISTAHIREATAINMERYASWISPESGYIVNTCTLSIDTAEYPDDLKQLAEFAHAQGCDYLRLDGDAPVLRQFPQYNW